jgi:hypothetical protein
MADTDSTSGTLLPLWFDDLHVPKFLVIDLLLCIVLL